MKLIASIFFSNQSSFLRPCLYDSTYHLNAIFVRFSMYIWEINYWMNVLSVGVYCVSFIIYDCRQIYYRVGQTKFCATEQDLYQQKNS